jgi:Amt family ammonium transporter
MKKLLFSLSLLATLYSSGWSARGADAAPPKRVDPTVEQRLADLEAYVNNGARVADGTNNVSSKLGSYDEKAGSYSPSPGPGHNGWMMTSSALVLFMTLPGLALFYGGLVRSKNMLSVLMQVFVIFSLISVLWALYGYSLAFNEGNAYFGNLAKAFLKGLTPDSNTGTFSKGVVLPELIYVGFQGAFAAITVCLIVGAFVERIKFSALLVFSILWFTFSYAPIAHMVWFWMGPDVYTAPGVVDATNAKAGLLWQWGALDFAGGTVVHISSGVSALLCALLLGKRLGYGHEPMPPHNLTYTAFGAALLWVGSCCCSLRRLERIRMTDAERACCETNRQAAQGGKHP